MRLEFTMKILQIAPVERRVPPHKHGGIERVVYNLVEGLCRRGHDVTLLASADSVVSAKLHPLITLPLLDDETCGADLKSREAYFSAVVARALCFINGKHFDVVHNHLGWRLIPFHNLITSPFVTTLQTPLDSPAKDIIFDEAAECSIVSVSDRQRLGRPKLNYVATVYNGVDMSLYSLSKENKGYLVFLGRMAPEKGPVEAIKIAKSLSKPLIMAAAVHPWETDYFREEVLPLIDHRQISYVGELNDQQKNELLGGAEALLNPIQWEEPFGIACVEAMACGTPVITLRRGAMPELIKDGVTGIVGSTLDELVDRYSEIHSIDRHTCRKHAQAEFCSEVMVEGYLEVYEALRSTTPQV
ncbi:MAG TPA: glycosyltransferase family 4 protein [Pyrinomonadaceae bacterium]|nr:glycosyltransferase family 4 protein [Pyrinomonadaceae bacterium]